MKQFNLKEYLANPERRKVVTRSGRPVEILGIALNKKLPVIGYIADDKYPSVWYANGRRRSGVITSENDLFFVDEKEEPIRWWPRWYRAKACTKLPGEAVIIYDIDPEPRLGKVMVSDGRYMLVKELEELSEE